MSTLQVGTISEKVTDAGVSVDGVTLKDGAIVVANGANIGSASDTDAMSISSGGVVTFSQKPVFSAGGVGKVLQVVTATSNTGSSNSQVTTETVYETVSITPSATSSKILVGVEGAGSVICGSSGIMQAQIYRGDTSGTKISQFYDGLGSATNGHEHYINVTLLAVDSPNTTSATTYTFSAERVQVEQQ